MAARSARGRLGGYGTPNLNKLAKQGVSFTRMYTEPSCTPTRTAFLTGRLPVRSHMLEPKVVPPEGAGLNADEVTIAEILSMAGYNTAHIGKWHQGDIEQAYPHNQGFDVANFPLHNQATFGVMHREAEEEAGLCKRVAGKDIHRSTSGQGIGRMRQRFGEGRQPVWPRCAIVIGESQPVVPCGRHSRVAGCGWALVWLKQEAAFDSAERESSSSMNILAARCLSAWKVPINTPNCLRVLR